MPDPSAELRRAILRLCMEAQEKLGDNQSAVVWVTNALLEATATYFVQCTAEDREAGKKLYNELSLNLAKVAQEFFTKYSNAGAALIVELPPNPEAPKN